MARPCVICSHPDRAEIDTLILNGKNPGITGRYDVSSSASSRHRLNHVQPSVVAAAQAREDLSAESIMTKLSELSGRAEKLLAAAGAAGDRAAAAKLIKECRETLTTLGARWGSSRRPRPLCCRTRRRSASAPEPWTAPHLGGNGPRSDSSCLWVRRLTNTRSTV
jgi:hypothetical protein